MPASMSCIFYSGRKGDHSRNFCEMTTLSIATTTDLPRAESFRVLIIFAANSKPDVFWTHLFTMENAPLENNRETKKKIFNDTIPLNYYIYL